MALLVEGSELARYTTAFIFSEWLKRCGKGQPPIYYYLQLGNILNFLAEFFAYSLISS